MIKKSILTTLLLPFSLLSAEAFAVAIPNTVDVTGPNGELSRWFPQNNSISEGNVASDGVNFDRFDAFDGHHRLAVNGNFYSDLDGDVAVATTAAGTFIDFDAATVAGYSVDLQYAFLNGSGALRMFATITNLSGPTLLQISRRNNMGSDGRGTIIATGDGDLTVETSDRWIATDDNPTGSDPAIVYSFYSGLGITPSAITNSGPVSNDWQDVYDLPLPLGETVSMLWFTQMYANTSGAVAGASLFDSIAVDSDLLVGLSAAELNRTVNHSFNATVDVPAPASLALLALGLLHIRRKTPV